ncbi:hypothetical protein EVAR_12406_1 [Eumeta japonica]|uniref:Uncharacterized protein n=1 Tax=Eumeta variegata TaxID=151549 RepID=A0A4C1TZ73_EUMVA|nr:hypothetical protein EVAR_12406_1 [Eumeta japonica]
MQGQNGTLMEKLQCHRHGIANAMTLIETGYGSCDIRYLDELTVSSLVFIHRPSFKWSRNIFKNRSSTSHSNVSSSHDRVARMRSGHAQTHRRTDACPPPVHNTLT